MRFAREGWRLRVKVVVEGVVGVEAVAEIGWRWG